MLRIEEETIVVEYIRDARSLSHAEMIYLALYGKHEFFKDEANKIEKYDIYDLTTMSQLCREIFDNYIERCYPEDKHVEIAVPDIGHIEFRPMSNGLGLTVSYFNEIEEEVYNTNFSIDFLIDQMGH